MSTDKYSLDDIISSTNVLISAAGPFLKYSKDIPLICSKYSTH